MSDGRNGNLVNQGGEFHIETKELQDKEVEEADEEEYPQYFGGEDDASNTMNMMQGPWLDIELDDDEVGRNEVEDQEEEETEQQN